MFSVGYVCQLGCGSESEFSGVDGVEEGFGPVAHGEAVENPVGAAAGFVGHGFDALGVVFDEISELKGFFDGGEICSGEVFGEADSAGGVVVTFLDDGGYVGVSEEFVGGESVATGEQFVVFACGSQGDGVDEAVGLDVAGQRGDVVVVLAEAAVCGGVGVYAVAGDVRDGEGLLSWVGRVQFVSFRC